MNFHFKDNQEKNLILNRFVNKGLFMFGLGLFAGEGTKVPLTTGPNFVEFINSDPIFINSFLLFLEDLGFKREQCRFRVQLSCSQDELEKMIKSSTNFWRKRTRIHLKNFTKPNIRIRENSKQRSKHGCLCIRLLCKPLWRLLVYWIKNSNTLISERKI